MLKKYSVNEANILLSSQLYQLDNFANDISIIEAIGDLLPGVILINDMVKMENSYINNSGCSFLEKSRNEINEMGADYFSSDSFCKDEMASISRYFIGLAQRADETEVKGFYQKVRTNKSSDWKQYYLSGKLLKGTAGCFIYMGLEINKQRHSFHHLNMQLNITPIAPVTFQKFSSLSKREKEILRLIANGYASKDISDYLCIALFTVETHRKNINKKLGTKSLSDLIRISDLFNL